MSNEEKIKKEHLDWIMASGFTRTGEVTFTKAGVTLALVKRRWHCNVNGAQACSPEPWKAFYLANGTMY